MPDLTIVYLTDDSPMDPDVLRVCRRNVLESAGDTPIVAVSQTEDLPDVWGRRVKVWAMGRSWRSFYRQVEAGLDAATTPWVAIAERDNLYPPEHFAFRPPDPYIPCWYNDHMWMVQWVKTAAHPELNGTYSYHQNRQSFCTLLADRVALLAQVRRYLEVIHADARLLAMASGGRKAHKLRGYLEPVVPPLPSALFKTTTPILDIRHDANWSGQRRGTSRRMELPPWGRWDTWLTSQS